MAISEEHIEYIISAAIDLGTTHSGFAFSMRHDFSRDPTQINVKIWHDVNGGIPTYKAPTCVLFDEDQKFHSFGYQAEAKYLDLIDKENAIDWYFFKRFKMRLYDQKVKLTSANKYHILITRLHLNRYYSARKAAYFM